MQILGAVISAAVLVAANGVTAFVIFTAFAVTPDGPWDVEEEASLVRLVSLAGGVFAVVTILLTLVVTGARWLHGRVWLIPPVGLFCCAVLRGLFPS